MAVKSSTPKSAPVAPVQDAVPVQDPVATPEPVSTPVPKTKAVKSPKVKATAPVVETIPEPVSADAPAEAPASAPVVEVSAFSLLEDKLALVTSALKEVTMQLRLVKKEHDGLRRIADRVALKRANARTTPNGFAKPSKISDELCDFLKVAKGSEKSRTEVTREINNYVKENSLCDPANKRIILVGKDATLTKLLATGDNDQVTYFNLQKFLKHHFIKPTAVVEPVVA